MTLKTLIANDEPPARKRLRQLLTADQDVEITEECRNGDEVVAALKSKRIDLVFLDIQMPGNTGFEAVGAVHMPLTVFVTAHNVYAVKAFDVHALDYLIKPIDQERLQIALTRVKERIAANSALPVQAQLNGFLLSINQTNNGVRWIEASDNYACLHVGSKTFLLRETIKQLVASLDPKKFVRVHRSAIVNVTHIRKILREGRMESWLLLSNGQRIRMSKIGWQSLMAATDSLSV